MTKKEKDDNQWQSVYFPGHTKLLNKVLVFENAEALPRKFKNYAKRLQEAIMSGDEDAVKTELITIFLLADDFNKVNSVQKKRSWFSKKKAVTPPPDPQLQKEKGLLIATAMWSAIYAARKTYEDNFTQAQYVIAETMKTFALEYGDMKCVTEFFNFGKIRKFLMTPNKYHIDPGEIISMQGIAAYCSEELQKRNPSIVMGRALKARGLPTNLAYG